LVDVTSRLAALAVSTIAILSIGLVGGETAAAATDLGPFTDDDGHPGEPYLEWLAERGIVHGCNPPANTRICPDRALSRAEAAKILIGTGRYAGTLPPFPSGLPDRFIDDDEVWGGSVSRLANQLAYAGVLDGCDPPVNRRFCPTSPLLRGQVAKILVGTLDLEAPSSYITPWTDTAGRFYHEAARVTAFLRMWDDSTGIFRGGSEVTRAEFGHAIVVALGEDACPVTPFTEARADLLRRRYPGQSFTAYAYDTRTGCAYWMNPDSRLRTASVFKVMVMAGTLLEAQSDVRPISSWERSQLVPMITESANDPVRALWRHFGGSPWFREQVESFGLDQTRAVGDSESGWGRTTTSAKDQADLIRQVLLGDWGPIGEAYRDQAWNLMTSVVPSQTWGITNGVPADWVVAQKNGFAGHIANSVGLVRQPDGGEGYVVAVLSNGWSDWARGVPAVEEISGWVSAALAR
jgi:beta-lactamase class A